MELNEQETEASPFAIELESQASDPKIVIQSQFRIKDMAIATSFFAAALAVIKAVGVNGYEALAGGVCVLVVCGLSVMFFEHGRRDRIFYRDRPF